MATKKTKSKKKKATPVKYKANNSNKPYIALVIMTLAVAFLLLENNSKSFNLDFKKFFKSKSKILTTDNLSLKKHKTVLPKKKEKLVAEKKEIIKNREKIKKIEKLKPGLKKIKIYFVKVNEQNEKIFLASIYRKLESASPLKETFSILLKGPSKREKRMGYLTALPKGLRINKIVVNGKTANIDFNKYLSYGASGNILLSRINQIVYTATQFPNIDNVLITINGKRKKSLGGDGLSIGEPLTRGRQ